MLNKATTCAGPPFQPILVVEFRNTCTHVYFIIQTSKKGSPALAAAATALAGTRVLDDGVPGPDSVFTVAFRL